MLRETLRCPPGFQECHLHGSHFTVYPGMILSQSELPCPRFHSPPKGNLYPKTHGVGRQQPAQPQASIRNTVKGRPLFTEPRGWPRSLLPSHSCCSVSCLTPRQGQVLTVPPHPSEAPHTRLHLCVLLRTVWAILDQRSGL